MPLSTKVPANPGERPNSDEALRESEERFRLLIEGVRDYAIFMLDPTGVVTTWNAGAERIKGYRPDEIIGQHFSKFYPPEDVAAQKPELVLATATQLGKCEQEGWRLRKDGTRFWANVLLTAIRNRSGELIGFGKVTRDLTERRAAEQRALDDARRVAAEEAARRAAEDREYELRSLARQLHEQALELELRSREALEARQRADDANRVKSQFLAAMSHELRTPLNAIGGYADLMAMGVSGPPTEQQLEYLNRIRRSQTHLLGIINDILNFSRIEAGQLTYDLGPFPVQAAISSVLHMTTPQAQAKGVRLGAGECPGEVLAWADRSKVEQIVLNLVSNAVKFTESGGSISVSCRRDPDGRVAIVVRDTGRGIPADQLDDIFEPFVQVGRSFSTSQEGAGLGLAISRDLARGMRGDIIVRSTLEQGSEFTVLLPSAKD